MYSMLSNKQPTLTGRRHPGSTALPGDIECDDTGKHPSEASPSSSCRNSTDVDLKRAGLKVMTAADPII